MCSNVKLSSVKVSPHKIRKLVPFFKFVALCSSLGGTYYRYIILLPIRIDSVMICCSKSIEISKYMVTGSPYATSNWTLLKTALIFFARSLRGEWARGYYGPK